MTLKSLYPQFAQCSYMRGELFQYFDRVAIIHLPSRPDRLAALRAELSRVGLDIHDPKVLIPHAPVPSDAHGFPSRGVFGNFLSHLAILRQARADNLETVLVLEDDAIFSRTFNSKQSALARSLASNPWDEVFLGHSISELLPPSPSGLVRFSGDFVWSHCYGIHRRAMPRLIDYFEQTINRPAGHPNGARMYVDAAHCWFRRLNPDVICLVGSPCMSVQKGSRSDLNATHWYDRNGILRGATEAARSMRDVLWRQGWINIRAKGQDQSTVLSAIPWPSYDT